MGARRRSLNQHSTILSSKDKLLERFLSCRGLTERLCANLSDADATVQSMEDASPAKWHLAHSSWFFETFVLRDHVEGYQLFDDQFPFLFNSYYEAEGARHIRKARGLITRPSLEKVMEYRHYVTAAIESAAEMLPEAALTLIELGINHEQQHQELLLTDILHLFSCNPTYPALWPEDQTSSKTTIQPIEWLEGPAGIAQIGHEGDGFAFDCEGPRHEILLEPYVIADRTITNGEWLAFIADGGYSQPCYWLSDGWAWVQSEGIKAPLYWVDDIKGWMQFTLQGILPLDHAAPVTHISLYEADAYTSWASQKLDGFENVRLPTEGEWEAYVQMTNIDMSLGHQLDDPGALTPIASTAGFFGNVWEWTGSAFRPYPKFTAAQGAVGEYNGKFMSGQFVLKGASCATPRGHVRSSYRNFFYPHQRWQFTGLRLAKYIG